MDAKRDPAPRFVPPPLPASRNIDRVRKSLLEQKAAIERGLREIADLEEKQRAEAAEDEEMEVDALFRDLTTRMAQLYIFAKNEHVQNQDHRPALTTAEAEKLLQAMKEIESRLTRLPAERGADPASEAEKSLGRVEEDVRLGGRLSERQRRGVAKANQRFVHSLRGIRARRSARAGERRKVSPSGLHSARLDRKEQADLSGLESSLEAIKAAGRKAVVKFDIDGSVSVLRNLAQKEPEMVRVVGWHLNAILQVLEAATLFRQRKNVAAKQKMTNASTLWTNATSTVQSKERQRSASRPESSCSSSSSAASQHSTPDVVQGRRGKHVATPIPFDSTDIALSPVGTESDVVGQQTDRPRFPEETNYCKLVLYCLRTSKSAGLFLSESILQEMESFLEA